MKKAKKKDDKKERDCHEEEEGTKVQRLCHPEITFHLMQGCFLDIDFSLAVFLLTE